MKIDELSIEEYARFLKKLQNEASEAGRKAQRDYDDAIMKAFATGESIIEGVYEIVCGEYDRRVSFFNFEVITWDKVLRELTIRRIQMPDDADVPPADIGASTVYPVTPEQEAQAWEGFLKAHERDGDWPEWYTEATHEDDK